MKISISSLLTAVWAVSLAVMTFNGTNRAFGGDDASESPYTVVWTTPSQNWNGTTPLGNGEVCANVWFDANAHAHILIARTDSWDDYGRLVKVGAVEINLLGEEPKPEQLTPFRQELDVRNGALVVSYGESHKQTSASVWIDTNRPVVVVEIQGANEVEASASLRPWRTGEGETLVEPMVSDLWYTPEKTERIVVKSDVVLSNDDLKASNRVLCYHRNVKTKYYDEIARTQGLDAFENHQPDPYVNRTFGLLLCADSGHWRDETTLTGTKGKTRRFEIVAHVAQTETVDEWLEQIALIADQAGVTPIETRRQQTQEYWREFTNRSWVCFSPSEKALAELPDDAKEALIADTRDVTKAYALQRYLFACQGRGAYPIKFNGGLFTVAQPGTPEGHDYRRWGPGYWWQNTRLPYYASITSGDFDLMTTFFERYCALVPICEFRAKQYLGVEGAYFPECVYLDGAVFPETYGLQPWSERQDKLQASGWHKREWVGGLELAFLAIQAYEYTLDEAFLKQKAIPTANAVLKFFDSYYQTDSASGKLAMSPAQALETWWDCDNPTPEIAGIRAVTQKLLALPKELTTEEDRAFWQALFAKTPEVPTRVDEKSGLKVLAAAGRFAQSRNVETPELYPVFPFRLYSFEKPEIELAQNAYKIRLNHFSTGWAQDDIFCAYLGDGEGVREHLATRARNGAKTERFPVFWGPNFDWIPDMDNGSVLNIVAQSLALQADGKRIFVAPVLPKGWNVDFKLWAPQNTTVQCKIVDGHVEALQTVPAQRLDDVEICLPSVE
ncbi:MAG: DUF5703 domain-containing protein [Planctomycetia bacterium]|nr:DUF5703 domain-containing protein [Planctomycetia bacterium]